MILLERAKAAGSDSDYRDFIRKQKSCISGAWAYWDCIKGEGRSEACHYRTAKNSGIATKPEYSCIPMTSVEHRKQHDIGQYNFMPRRKWEDFVDKYLKLWAESRGF